MAITVECGVGIDEGHHRTLVKNGSDLNVGDIPCRSGTLLVLYITSDSDSTTIANTEVGDRFVFSPGYDGIGDLLKAEGAKEIRLRLRKDQPGEFSGALSFVFDDTKFACTFTGRAVNNSSDDASTLTTQIDLKHVYQDGKTIGVLKVIHSRRAAGKDVSKRDIEYATSLLLPTFEAIRLKGVDEQLIKEGRQEVITKWLARLVGEVPLPRGLLDPTTDPKAYLITCVQNYVRTQMRKRPGPRAGQLATRKIDLVNRELVRSGDKPIVGEEYDRRVRDEVRAEQPVLTDDLEDAGAKPEDIAAKQVFTALINDHFKSAFLRLREQERAVLAFRYADEIIEGEKLQTKMNEKFALGRTVDATKQALHRATAGLQDELTDDFWFSIAMNSPTVKFDEDEFDYLVLWVRRKMDKSERDKLAQCALDTVKGILGRATWIPDGDGGRYPELANE